MEPAAMLIGAFQIHHGIRPAMDLAPDARKAGEMPPILQHEGVRRAGIEPDVENVVDLLPLFVGKAAEKTLTRAGRIPGIRAFGLERRSDALVHGLILQNLDRTI